MYGIPVVCEEDALGDLVWQVIDSCVDGAFCKQDYCGSAVSQEECCFASAECPEEEQVDGECLLEEEYLADITFAEVLCEESSTCIQNFGLGALCLDNFCQVGECFTNSDCLAYGLLDYDCTDEGICLPDAADEEEALAIVDESVCTDEEEEQGECRFIPPESLCSSEEEGQWLCAHSSAFMVCVVTGTDESGETVYEWREAPLGCPVGTCDTSIVSPIFASSLEDLYNSPLCPYNETEIVQEQEELLFSYQEALEDYSTCVEEENVEECEQEAQQYVVAQEDVKEAPETAFTFIEGEAVDVYCCQGSTNSGDYYSWATGCLPSISEQVDPEFCELNAWNSIASSAHCTPVESFFGFGSASLSCIAGEEEEDLQDDIAQQALAELEISYENCVSREEETQFCEDEGED